MTLYPRAPFPSAYYEGFLDLLVADERIKVITYDDLPWSTRDTYRSHYPREWERWRALVKDDGEARRSIFVLLQHDVDLLPELTHAALELEAARGLRSTVLIFNRLVDRTRLREDEIVEFTPYEIDVPRLQALERDHGFVVGYHSNAVEQARWDLRRAARIFRRDVRELRRHFHIRFFSPHGGVPGPNGENNTSLAVPHPANPRLRWVANRYGPRFDGSYSDGGIYGRPLDDRDLRDFVRTWKPGGRYRVLTHPQYYGASAPMAQFEGVDWCTRLFGATPGEIWAGVAPV